DSNQNYKLLNSKNIIAGIKPRKVKGRLRSGMKSNKERRKAIKEYFKDENSWKKSVNYGLRWSCESAFSAFKRIFGEHVTAKKFRNMVKEIQLKVFAFNALIKLS
ncbi:MAG: transposase, partial [Candidatus Thermoplasmatota archaeon]|nr:transposase [Candidatus Thermoplasmatota archaeon]